MPPAAADVKDTAKAYGIDRRIRFGHRVRRAAHQVMPSVTAMIGIRLVRNIAVMQWRAPGTAVWTARASASAFTSQRAFWRFCGGTFSVLHNDRIGPLRLPCVPAPYGVTAVSP